MGLSRNATTQEIRKAYKELARKFHPDKNNNKAMAEEQFKMIDEAYRMLSDPQTKLMLDRELAAAEMKAKAKKGYKCQI